jgi:hypothetical protein
LAGKVVVIFFIEGIPNSIEAPAPKKNPILSGFIGTDFGGVANKVFTDHPTPVLILIMEHMTGRR